jgi:hypothetical protein
MDCDHKGKLEEHPQGADLRRRDTILGFKCTECGVVLDPQVWLSSDLKKLHWYGLVRNPDVKAAMNADDPAQNLAAYFEGKQPMHVGRVWFKTVPIV